MSWTLMSDHVRSCQVMFHVCLALAFVACFVQVHAGFCLTAVLTFIGVYCICIILLLSGWEQCRLVFVVQLLVVVSVRSTRLGFA